MGCFWSLRGKVGQTDQTQIDILILTGLSFSPPSGFVFRHNCSLEISVQKCGCYATFGWHGYTTPAITSFEWPDFAFSLNKIITQIHCSNSLHIYMSVDNELI